MLLEMEREKKTILYSPVHFLLLVVHLFKDSLSQLNHKRNAVKILVLDNIG